MYGNGRREDGKLDAAETKAMVINGAPTIYSTALAGVAAEAVSEQRREISVNTKPFYLFTKRLCDIVISAVALVVLSPVMLIAMAAIKIEQPRAKALFHQPRIGWKGTEFKCHKLTSMVPDAESLLKTLTEKQQKEFAENFKIEDDPRVTRVGRFIRKTSIDELPQLWNVLKGQMSLVGPRPPLLEERRAYGEHLKKVMSVRPGITGYWQVHGRSDTDFGERIEMAEYYVDHCGIRMDLRILLDTVRVVLSCKGAV